MVGQYLPQTNETSYSVLQCFFRTATVDFRGTKHSRCCRRKFWPGPTHDCTTTCRCREQGRGLLCCRVRPVSEVSQTCLGMKSTKMLLNARLGTYPSKLTQGCSKINRSFRIPSNIVETREEQQIQELEVLDFEEEKM